MAWKELSSLSAEERQKHEDDYGRYNDFPRNWREIEEGEMAQSMFFTYSPRLVEHRQMIHQTKEVDGKRVRVVAENRAPFVGATLFFMHDGSGFGLVNDYWGKTIKWYQFDGPCDHEMVGVRSSMCYHESKCKHCGYREAIDSSD